VDTEDQDDVENEATIRMVRARFTMPAGAVLITLGMLLIVSGYIGTPRSDTAMGSGVVILVSGALALLNAWWTIQRERRGAADEADT